MNKTLLIIGMVWPEPTSSAAGQRMLQLIKVFSNMKFDITFACAAAKNSSSYDLNSIGVKSVSIALNCDTFDDFIKNLNPNIVVYDRYITEEQYGWRITEHCPNALKILDTEDLHGLRKAREIAFKQNDVFGLQHLHNPVMYRELASIYRCDLSLIISKSEMDFLNKMGVPSFLIHYLPFLIETKKPGELQNLPSFEERKDFVTIGNFRHAPNYQSILKLRQLWPKLKIRIPKARLLVYGAYESGKVSQLNNITEGFIIKGFATDVSTVMQQAKVCLAPLPFGAGLKGKVFDAMLNGTPVVTSTIGSEGIFSSEDLKFSVADREEAFVEYAATLYGEKNLWIAYQQKSFELIHNRFDKALFETSFKNKLLKLLANIKSHRLQNFTGGMLTQQSFQSSKYLSKWIMEKQKNTN
jgi:O-antigen biosynthesis protein